MALADTRLRAYENVHVEATASPLRKKSHIRRNILSAVTKTCDFRWGVLPRKVRPTNTLEYTGGWGSRGTVFFEFSQLTRTFALPNPG